MRAGWNRYLRDWLWAPDAKAQLIAEAIVVAHEDVKDLRDDWDGADSLLGLQSVDRGGIQLSESTTLELDRSTTPDTDITTLGPADPMTAVFVQWMGSSAHDGQLKNVVMRVDPQVDNGLPRNVELWKARAYRLSAVGPDEGRVELDLIGECEVRESGAAVHDITFTFTHDGRGASIGGPPEVLTDDTGKYGSATTLSYPSTAIILFALDANGAQATNCSWRGKANATAAGGIISTSEYEARTWSLTDVDLSGREESNAGTGGAWTQLTPSTTFPYLQVNRQSFSAPATATFTSNPANLGAVPTGDVQVVAQGEEPSDSSLTWDVSADGSVWHECSDGDLIGETNTGSGHDLSAVPKQQTYKLRVTLTPSSTGLQTPVARRFGVQELESVDLAGAAVVQGCSWGVDPVTLKGEIGQPTIGVMKTGDRDYRDYFSTIFSQYHIGQIQMRLWVGHPDLERRYWLHLDTFDVEDLDPKDSQGTAICLSVLGRLRTAGKIPLFDSGSGTRTPIEYAGQTIPAAYDDLLDSQIALAARLRGPGIASSVADTVSKVIRESDGKDEIDGLAYLAGYAVISSQGRVKAVQMMEDEGSERPPVAYFPREEVKPIQLGPGFTQRIDEFFVKTGFNEDRQEWEGDESRGTWVAGLDEKLRSRGVESKSELDEEVAKWIDTSDLGDKIAKRVVKHFACGMMLWEVKTTYPHPYLEPGDVVVVQTDQFVARSPIDDRAVKGVVSAKGTITQVMDALGTHFVVWVKSFADIVTTEDNITRIGYERPEFLQAQAIFGNDGSLKLRAQISIPSGSVRAVDDGSAFQSEATTRAATATASDAAGWVEVALAPAGTYDIAEDAYVTAFAYETAAGGGAESAVLLKIKATNENDADVDAEITGLQIGFTDSGYVIASGLWDEDAAAGRVFFTVGLGSSPSDPTSGANDGYIDPAGARSGTITFNGSGVTTAKQADMGMLVYVKARARNDASVLFDAFQVQRRRGDAQFVPPRVAYEASRAGTTVTISLTVDDPSLSVTAVQYNQRDGTEGAVLGGLTAWTGGTGTIGSTTQLTRSRSVTNTAGVDGEFTGDVTYLDEKGATKHKQFTINLANLQDLSGDIEISFADLLPVSDNLFNNYQVSTGSGSVDVRVGGNDLFMVGGLQMPKGVPLTNLYARMWKNAVGDIALCKLLHRDTSDAVNTISTMTLSATGAWTDVPDSAPGHTTTDGPYYLRVEMKGAAIDDARFARFRATYSRPSLQRVI